MKVSNIKYISIRGSNKDVTTISKIENILTKDRFYKTLEFLNVEELNNFIGELITLKQNYFKKCFSADMLAKDKQAEKDKEELKRYEKYIRNM